MTNKFTHHIQHGNYLQSTLSTLSTGQDTHCTVVTWLINWLNKCYWASCHMRPLCIHMITATRKCEVLQERCYRCGHQPATEPRLRIQHSTSLQHWASIHTQNTTNTAMTAPASNIRGILNIDSNSVISTVLLCFKKPLLLLGIVWYLHNHLANILNIIL